MENVKDLSLGSSARSSSEDGGGTGGGGAGGDGGGSPAASFSASLARRFLELLADGKAHRPEELDHDGFSDKARAAAIRLLTKEGRIELRDGFFRLSQTEP